MNELKEKIHRINCLTAGIDSLYHQAAVKLGVSDSVLFVLYMLCTNDGSCLLSEIIQSSGISKQTFNSAIRKLESENIVYLEKHIGKSKMVCLTEKGKEYVQHNALPLIEAERQALSDWDEEELDTYLRLIEKYDCSFRREVKKL